MEKCLKPNGACSFILPNMETRCAQVHSIHRLLVFEKGKGFFIDSFKIPTGCTCQVIKAGTERQYVPSFGQSSHKNKVAANHNSEEPAFVSSYDTRLNIGPGYTRDDHKPHKGHSGHGHRNNHEGGSATSSNKYFSRINQESAISSAPVDIAGHQEGGSHGWNPSSNPADSYHRHQQQQQQQSGYNQGNKNNNQLSFSFPHCQQCFPLLLLDDSFTFFFPDAVLCLQFEERRKRI